MTKAVRNGPKALCAGILGLVLLTGCGGPASMELTEAPADDPTGGAADPATDPVTGPATLTALEGCQAIAPHGGSSFVPGSQVEISDVPEGIDGLFFELREAFSDDPWVFSGPVDRVRLDVPRLDDGTPVFPGPDTRAALIMPMAADGDPEGGVLELRLRTETAACNPFTVEALALPQPQGDEAQRLMSDMGRVFDQFAAIYGFPSLQAVVETDLQDISVDLQPLAIELKFLAMLLGVTADGVSPAPDSLAARLASIDADGLELLQRMLAATRLNEQVQSVADGLMTAVPPASTARRSGPAGRKMDNFEGCRVVSPPAPTISTTEGLSTAMQLAHEAGITNLTGNSTTGLQQAVGLLGAAKGPTGTVFGALGDVSFVLLKVSEMAEGLLPSQFGPLHYDLLRPELLEDDRDAGRLLTWDNARVTAMSKGLRITKAIVDTAVFLLGKKFDEVAIFATVFQPQLNTLYDQLNESACLAIEPFEYGEFEITDERWTEATADNRLFTQSEHQVFLPAQVGSGLLRVSTRRDAFPVDLAQMSMPLSVLPKEVSVTPVSQAGGPSEPQTVTATVHNTHFPDRVTFRVTAGQASPIGQPRFDGTSVTQDFAVGGDPADFPVHILAESTTTALQGQAQGQSIIRFERDLRIEGPGCVETGETVQLVAFVDTTSMRPEDMALNWHADAGALNVLPATDPARQVAEFTAPADRALRLEVSAAFTNATDVMATQALTIGRCDSVNPLYLFATASVDVRNDDARVTDSLPLPSPDWTGLSTSLSAELSGGRSDFGVLVDEAQTVAGSVGLDANSQTISELGLTLRYIRGAVTRPGVYRYGLEVACGEGTRSQSGSFVIIRNSFYSDADGDLQAAVIGNPGEGRVSECEGGLVRFEFPIEVPAGTASDAEPGFLQTDVIMEFGLGAQDVPQRTDHQFDMRYLGRSDLP